MPDTRKKPKPKPRTKKGRAKDAPARADLLEEISAESLAPLPVSPEDAREGPAATAPTTAIRAEPPVARELRAELWSEENPFDFADASLIDLGGPRPGLTPDLIDAILSETAPAFWLELGARLGGATTLIAERITAAGTETAILAVDSFTGDASDWLAEKGARERGAWRYLHLAAGAPTIYERFLANVQRAGNALTIVPLPSTPLEAMRLVRALVDEGRLSRAPAVIALDTSHEPDITPLALHRAWALLEPGGVLFGDHWSLPGMRNDVRAFARTVEADTTRMVAFLRRFEESYLDGNVFLYRGQWVLFRG